MRSTAVENDISLDESCHWLVVCQDNDQSGRSPQNVAVFHGCSVHDQIFFRVYRHFVRGWREGFGFLTGVSFSSAFC